jgi:hypothetical protein
MKIKVKQKNGRVGLNGEYWEVKSHIAIIPDAQAKVLMERHPDEFQQYTKEEVTEDGSIS